MRSFALAPVALAVFALAACNEVETEEPDLDPPEFGCTAVDLKDTSGATDAEKQIVWQIEEATPFQQILDDGTQRATYDVKIPGEFNLHVEWAAGTTAPGAILPITRGEFLTPASSRFKGAAICMGEGSEIELGDGAPDTCAEAVTFRRITMRALKNGSCGPGAIEPIAGELVLTAVH